jgi:predicted nucleic acid-binding protein
VRYLLDTNVISEVRKRKPHGAVIAWLTSLSDDEALVPCIALGELQAGVERTRRQDPAKAAELEEWIDRLSDTFQVIAMDGPCFREWARLMQNQPDDLLEDAMIAAIARVHDVTVATRNEQDFARLRVKLFNPFK